jgi:hypothetical protein
MIIVLSIGSGRTAVKSTKKAAHPDGLEHGEGGPP